MHNYGNYNLLLEKIDTFIRRYYANKLLRGTILWAAVLFSGYVVAVLSEYLGQFDVIWRSLIFFAFILVNLALIIGLILPPLLAYFKLGNTIDHKQAAEIIGEHFADVQDKLLNTLQLKKLADESPAQRQLIEASIDQKIETLKPVSFPSAVNIRQNVKYVKWIVLPASVICVIALAAPSVLTESTRRLIRHNEYFAPVAPFKFVVLNQQLSAVQGEDLKLNIKLEGNNLPSDVYIETAGNSFRLNKENVSHFNYLITNLQQNVSFRLSGGGYSSPVYEISVNLKPSLLHFDAHLSYPTYLHKKNETIANAGDLTIPAGTVVQWQLHTQNTSNLFFSLNDKVTRVNASGTDLFEHAERIIKNSVYSLKPVNNRVLRGESASYRINVVSDELPVINVQEKSDSISSKALYFSGKIQDDHGFSSLTFHYTIGQATSKNSRSFTKAVKADLSQTQADFFYYWNLKQLGAKPGEQVTYFFEVADNDQVMGPKRVRSTEHTLNMPTEQELNLQLNQGTQVVKQKMQSAIKLAGQLERDEQRLNQQLLNKSSLSFDEKKQIEDLLQKRKDLNDLIKEAQDENKKNILNRQENQKQDAQLTELQKQMEQLMEGINDPKTEELLRKLQEHLQQDQKESTQEQLGQMQQQNKSLKKELDRMLELYKHMDFDQKLNQNINALNNLSQEQQKLAEQTQQKSTDQQSLQQQQQKLQQKFEDVKKGLDELKKANEQLDQKENLENPSAEEQQIDNQMQQSAQELKKNNSSKASKAQQQAAQQMQQLAKKLQQDSQEGDQQQNMVNARQLRELLKNLVNSSFDQEKIMQSFKSISSTDPNYVTLAQKQKDVKDNLKTAEDSLYPLSRRVPQIQSTVNEEISSINTQIDKALENLGDRRTFEAVRNQQYAMTSMNNLALMLNEVLDQLQNMMNNARGGKGKQQMSMSQIAQLQQQLNSNMQQARSQLQQQGNQGQSQHQGLSERFARMARQQQNIRQMLQQMNNNAVKNGKNNTGEIDKITHQMEQTENDLVNRRITDESLKRQQQIQTRLLEAEKAEQEREQDQQRQSNAGKDMPPGYIKALQQYQQQKLKQTEQIRTVSPALNLYYKEKVKNYFDQLNGK
jgi:hypothetical protein